MTKLSWRGRYHRILVVNATHILTFYPDSLTLTNSWALAGDHDLVGVEGGEHPSKGGTFTLQFRRDKKAGDRGGGAHEARWRQQRWGGRSATAARGVGALALVATPSHPPSNPNLSDHRFTHAAPQRFAGGLIAMAGDQEQGSSGDWDWLLTIGRCRRHRLCAATAGPGSRWRQGTSQQQATLPHMVNAATGQPCGSQQMGKGGRWCRYDASVSSLPPTCLRGFRLPSGNGL